MTETIKNVRSVLEGTFAALAKSKKEIEAAEEALGSLLYEIEKEEDGE